MKEVLGPVPNDMLHVDLWFCRFTMAATCRLPTVSVLVVPFVRQMTEFLFWCEHPFKLKNLSKIFTAWHRLLRFKIQMTADCRAKAGVWIFYVYLFIKAWEDIALKSSVVSAESRWHQKCASLRLLHLYECVFLPCRWLLLCPKLPQQDRNNKKADCVT